MVKKMQDNALKSLVARLDEIKETWQIFEIFEAEKKRLNAEFTELENAKKNAISDFNEISAKNAELYAKNAELQTQNTELLSKIAKSRNALNSGDLADIKKDLAEFLARENATAKERGLFSVDFAFNEIENSENSKNSDFTKNEINLPNSQISQSPQNSEQSEDSGIKLIRKKKENKENIESSIESGIESNIESSGQNSQNLQNSPQDSIESSQKELENLHKKSIQSLKIIQERVEGLSQKLNRKPQIEPLQKVQVLYRGDQKMLANPAQPYAELDRINDFLAQLLGAMRLELGAVSAVINAALKASGEK